MLEKKVFDNFITECQKAWQQFCVWKYANNYFAKRQDEFNKIVKDGFSSSEEDAIKNSCKCKNFWDVVIPSLQHSWILSVARLIDPPYFKNDKDKSRLSIYYIIELLDDNELGQVIKNELNNQKDFLESMKTQRDGFIAHNSIGYNNKNIKAGVENFFNRLDNTINKIKNKKPHLNRCNNINIDFTDKLSEAGVKEIFNDIVK